MMVPVLTDLGWIGREAGKIDFPDVA